MYHNEPIWCDGQLFGRVTSGMFGHTIGTCSGLGYINNPDGTVDASFRENARFEVEVAGVRVSARASLRSFYDPHHRVRDVNESALDCSCSRRPAY
ncbi:glycine cleavage T C-terminal barrel domain-containing protein [Bradyrhizobium sp. USDA 4461]